MFSTDVKLLNLYRTPGDPIVDPPFAYCPSVYVNMSVTVRLLDTEQ